MRPTTRPVRAGGASVTHMAVHGAGAAGGVRASQARSPAATAATPPACRAYRWGPSGSKGARRTIEHGLEEAAEDEAVELEGTEPPAARAVLVVAATCHTRGNRSARSLRRTHPWPPTSG